MSKRRKRNSSKKIILGIFISLIFLMSAGYAAFQTTLTLNARANIISKGTITIDELKKQVVNTGDGLYEDIYEPERYIYRGTDPNNYVLFNGSRWRIVSIEKNNSLKITRLHSINNLVFDTPENRNTGYCEYDTAIGCNVWAATPEYDNHSTLNGGVKGEVSIDSSLKTYLNDEYYISLSEEDKSLIQASDFYYGAVTYGNDDLANQIEEEKAYSAQSNVGLIQLSDYLKANTDYELCGTYKKITSNYSSCAQTNYLVRTNLQWTTNPVYYNGYSAHNNKQRVYAVEGNGDIHRSEAATKNYVYPVVFLKPEIKLKGPGTSDDPYTIT